jgi:excisionase family DNA binding protein
MMSTPRTREILTPDQAADYLQVDRETIYRYIRSGKLDASKLGRSYRIPRSSIDLLMLATRARPYVKLRQYTAEQVDDFMRRDVLEGDALRVARQFEQATGGTFFGDEKDNSPA